MPSNPMWGYGVLAAVLLAAAPSSLFSQPGGPKAGAPPLPGEAPGRPKIEFVDTTPLLIDRIEGDDFVGVVLVSSDEAKPQDVSIALVGVNSRGQAIGGRIAAKKALARGVTPVELRITRAGDVVPPVTGHLSLRLDQGASDPIHLRSRPFRIAPPLPSTLSDAIVLGGLFTSALVVVIAGARLRALSVRPGARMGAPTWSFGDSWGSNIGLGGALLTQLLGLLLPEQSHHVNRSAYTALGLIFGLLVMVAPTVYNLFRMPVATAGAAAVVEYQGFVGTFLLASAFTLWGAFGQLGTIGALFAELMEARYIAYGTFVAMTVVLLLLAGCLLFYGFRAIVSLATAQKARHDASRAIRPRAEAAGEAERGDAEPVRLPGWVLI